MSITIIMYCMYNYYNYTVHGTPSSIYNRYLYNLGNNVLIGLYTSAYNRRPLLLRGCFVHKLFINLGPGCLDMAVIWPLIIRRWLLRGSMHAYCNTCNSKLYYYFNGRHKNHYYGGEYNQN